MYDKAIFCGEQNQEKKERVILTDQPVSGGGEQTNEVIIQHMAPKHLPFQPLSL